MIHCLPGRYFYFYFLLAPLMFAGCVNSSQQVELNRKINILESRVVVLEKQKQKSVSDLINETKLFKVKISNDIRNFRKSQRFFISELDQLKNDTNLVTNDLEKSQRTARTIKMKLNRINKKLGDLTIAIHEMQQFFDEKINDDTRLPEKQRQEYEQYFQLFRAKHFDQAKKGFLTYIRKYPSSQLTDDSMYLIAYMHFLSNEYQKASVRFFELLAQFPDSNRLHETKWWLGVSLERTGDLNGALDLYKELIKLPKASPLRIKAEFRLEELTSN